MNSAANAWTMDCIRNKAGVHTVHGTKPDGQPFAEPLAVTAAADRTWSNPPEEITQLREIAAWYASRQRSESRH